MTPIKEEIGNCCRHKNSAKYACFAITITQKEKF